MHVPVDAYQCIERGGKYALGLMADIHRCMCLVMLMHRKLLSFYVRDYARQWVIQNTLLCIWKQAMVSMVSCPGMSTLVCCC